MNPKYDKWNSPMCISHHKFLLTARWLTAVHQPTSHSAQTTNKHRSLPWVTHQHVNQHHKYLHQRSLSSKSVVRTSVKKFNDSTPVRSHWSRPHNKYSNCIYTGRTIISVYASQAVNKQWSADWSYLPQLVQELSMAMPSFLAGVRQLCLLAKLWSAHTYSTDCSTRTTKVVS